MREAALQQPASSQPITNLFWVDVSTYVPFLEGTEDWFTGVDLSLQFLYDAFVTSGDLPV